MLREGYSNRKKDSRELDDSSEKTKHRKAEKKRRETIRSLQDQISVFFLVKGDRKVSVGDLLLFGKLIIPTPEIGLNGMLTNLF